MEDDLVDNDIENHTGDLTAEAADTTDSVTLSSPADPDLPPSSPLQANPTGCQKSML